MCIRDRDHLDFHPTMRDYFEAKALLFAAGSPTRAVRSVVCVDDEWGRRMLDVARRGKGIAPITVSTTDVPAEWHAGPSTIESDGSQRVEIADAAGIGHDLTLRLPGRYNVANATLAVAVVVAAGVPVTTATAAIADVSVPVSYTHLTLPTKRIV